MTVNTVFDNYKRIFERHPLEPCEILTNDETGKSTMHEPPKILAPKDMQKWVE